MPEGHESFRNATSLSYLVTSSRLNWGNDPEHFVSLFAVKNTKIVWYECGTWFVTL